MIPSRHWQDILKQIQFIEKGEKMKPYYVPVQNMNFEKEMETIQPLDKYKKIGESIGSLVDEKNRAYGDSFNKAGDFLKLLYPNGVQPDQYGDMLGLVRVFDKQMRIATAKDALGENPWADICGYSILRVESGRKPDDKRD